MTCPKCKSQTFPDFHATCLACGWIMSEPYKNAIESAIESHIARAEFVDSVVTKPATGIKAKKGAANHG